LFEKQGWGLREEVGDARAFGLLCDVFGILGTFFFRSSFEIFFVMGGGEFVLVLMISHITHHMRWPGPRLFLYDYYSLKAKRECLGNKLFKSECWLKMENGRDNQGFKRALVFEKRRLLFVRVAWSWAEAGRELLLALLVCDNNN